MWSRRSRRRVPTNRSAKEFARGDRTGVLITRVLFPAKTSSNAAVNLLSPVMDQEPEATRPLAEIHEQVPRLLSSPGPGRMSR
jgi:hypothetical protein